MIHIVAQIHKIGYSVGLRHEYWEEEKYNLPKSDKDRKPYYVCYEY